MQEPSKDNSGDKIYLKRKDVQKEDNTGITQGKDGIGEVVDHYERTPQDLNDYVLDDHEHLIVKHDLLIITG